MMLQRAFENKVRIEGEVLPVSAFLSDTLPSLATKSPFHHQICVLIQQWLSKSTYFPILTSGSTSDGPKQMVVEKALMLNSVAYTRDYFDLQPEMNLLLSLPVGYIAGTMMVIRALSVGMNLYLTEPTGRPLHNRSFPPIHFASMAPLQIYNTLAQPEERARLESFENLIVVGGAVGDKIERELRKFPNTVCSTYGMAETLSHIAMRRISGPDASDRYTAFEDVVLSLSDQGTLRIQAPRVSREILQTRDLAEIDEQQHFRLLGRVDNIIVSGSVKISAESVERMLQPVINGLYAISSIPDPKFGEAVVLVVEEPVSQERIDAVLPPYFRPKRIVVMKEIPMTETEKIKRGKLKELLRNTLLR